ncbi:ABC transporter permease [Achromobacter aloeverae]|uniref:Peptide ABC transporter permease n=1 Tax=Achromobacter aloeverae TaxID=1750518 RepID=A0A4Q1HLM4_9BURK|nr:ABC transporter permease [Achromobacter aloeverae]RXN91248.1 peptide ABC transporter permease [Achromobacter aloeverae]
MSRYLVRRTAQALLVLWLAYTASYALLFLIPLDPISVRLADPDNPVSPEDAARILSYYGLDRPAWEQYLGSLHRLFQGDLGYSLISGERVGTLIGKAVPSTLQLTGLGLAFAVLLALAIVTVATLTRWKALRAALELLPSLFVSVPMFWLGLLVIQLFSFRLGLFVAVDDQAPSSLLFAALAMALPVSAPLAAVLMASVQAVYHEPFVDVLKTKGAGAARIYTRHVLRNALMPALTVLGITAGELVAGAVVTETIFSRPGLGFLTERSVASQDLPVIQAVVLFAAAVFVFANWLVDVAHPLVDPRVRASRAANRALPLAEEPKS